MRLAHLADLHLGFRQYGRTTARGQDQREVDVATALARVVDDLLVQRPDIVAIAGDVFHSVRPTNSAILTLFQQLQRVRCALPDTRIIIVAGNHDTPRSSDTTFILPLYQALGVDVALLEPLVVRMGGVTVTAVPSAAAARIPSPDAAADVNVLVLHAGVAGFSGPAPRGAVDPESLTAWDYVALGDYHVCAQVGSRAWYSGAIDYTATDPWGEVRKQAELGLAGKGYLLVDLPGAPEFRPIAPPRRFYDLEPIDATGLGAAELDAAIAERVASIDVAGAVARLVVSEVRQDVRRALNHAQVRAWRAKALHFQLELNRCEDETSAEHRALVHQKLDDTVRSFLTGRPLAPDVDRQAFVEQGMEYFAAAAEA